MDSKGKGASSCQIPHIPRNPRDPARVDFSICQRIEKFVDDKEEVEHCGIGAIFWKFDQYVQFFDENEREKRQEEDDRQPLRAELAEHEAILGRDGLRTAAAIEEEEDDRVELVDDEIDVYHTEQDEVESSDKSKPLLPLAPQQPANRPLHVLVLGRHVDHIDPASYERNHPRQHQDDRASDHSCRSKENGHGEHRAAHHRVEHRENCRRRRVRPFALQLAHY